MIYGRMNRGLTPGLPGGPSTPQRPIQQAPVVQQSPATGAPVISPRVGTNAGEIGSPWMKTFGRVTR